MIMKIVVVLDDQPDFVVEQDWGSSEHEARIRELHYIDGSLVIVKRRENYYSGSKETEHIWPRGKWLGASIKSFLE